MKHCPNPGCDSSFLYGSNKNVCPFCHTVLSESITNINNLRAHIVSPSNVYMADNNDRDYGTEHIESFSTPIRGGVRYHGRITEVEHHEVFNSKWHKLFNSLFRGEPYQFAHQTSEYTVRLESITEGYPNDITDVCMYGNYLGRIHVGDEVTVNARNYRNRRVVNSMYNHTTGTEVRPGLQLPAVLIRGLAIGIVATVIALFLVLGILVETGVLGEWLVSLFASLLPILVIGIIVFSFVFGRLPRRRK